MKIKCEDDPCNHIFYTKKESNIGCALLQNNKCTEYTDSQPCVTSVNSVSSQSTIFTLPSSHFTHLSKVKVKCKGQNETLVMLNILGTTLLPIFYQLTCSIPVVSMYFLSEWKTLWMLTSLLHPCSTQLSKKFILLINVKMPTNVVQDQDKSVSA